MTEVLAPANEMLTLEFDFECNVRDVDQFALPVTYLLPLAEPEPEEEDAKHVHEPIHCPDILVSSEPVAVAEEEDVAPMEIVTPAQPQAQPVDTPALLPKGWRKLNIAELRDLCRELSLPTDGSKADLIKRLADTQ